MRQEIAKVAQLMLVLLGISSFDASGSTLTKSSSCYFPASVPDGTYVHGWNDQNQEPIRNEGAALAQRAYARFGKIGFVDRRGQIVIPAVYVGAGNFGANGLAPVAITGSAGFRLWGYVNTKCQMVIEPKYLGASEFGKSDFAAVIDSDRKVALINSAGQFIGAKRFRDMRWKKGPFDAFLPVEFPFGRLAVRENDLWGYIKQDGEWVIPPRFEEASQFGHVPLAAVRLGSRWGYIDLHGEMVIRPAFDSADEFASDHLAIVGINKRYGFINAAGVFKIRPTFATLHNFGDHAPSGLARASSEVASEGLIDMAGAFVLRPMPCCLPRSATVLDPGKKLEVAEEGFSINGLRAYAQLVGGALKWGYINTKGRIAIKAKYEYAGPFAPNGLARVALNDVGNIGFISASGSITIPPKFACASDFSSGGAARVQMGNIFGLIDSAGKFIIVSSNMILSEIAQMKLAMTSSVRDDCALFF